MEITCPHCWESISIEELYYTQDTIELVLDCEVCCRPTVVHANWVDEEEDPVIDAQRNLRFLLPSTRYW